ncbi:hypothetical protein NKG94_46390 [Micromonospora sp. M12]
MSQDDVRRAVEHPVLGGAGGPPGGLAEAHQQGNLRLDPAQGALAVVAHSCIVQDKYLYDTAIWESEWIGVPNQTAVPSTPPRWWPFAIAGIAVVDPILPAIGDAIGVSAWQVELLFTAYIAVMALA